MLSYQVSTRLRILRVWLPSSDPADIGLRDLLNLFRPFATSKEEPAQLAQTKPLQATETDPVSRRAHILEELQSTERHFLARMQHLLQDYHVPLKTRAKSPDPILNMYQVNTLFPRSLEVIVKAHETFYEALAGAEEHEIPGILVEHVLPPRPHLIVLVW